jgi:uncharacterized protein (DUF433 family)
MLLPEVVQMVLTESFVAEPPPLRMTEDGVILVGRTRVPLDTVVGEYEDGATPDEIVQSFSSLDLADVYAVIGYYLRHRDEVEAYLQRRREQAAEVRRENEARFPSGGIRERLLARRQGTQ